MKPQRLPAIILPRSDRRRSARRRAADLDRADSTVSIKYGQQWCARPESQRDTAFLRWQAAWRLAAPRIQDGDLRRNLPAGKCAPVTILPAGIMLVTCPCRSCCRKAGVLIRSAMVIAGGAHLHVDGHVRRQQVGMTAGCKLTLFRPVNATASGSNVPSASAMISCTENCA